MRLNILDQSPIPEGSTAGDALRNTIDLARWAEQHGYHRYWLAEHHGTPGLACASPEVMVGPIAAATSRLHVGTGGIMLPHYSPLKVAETFSMLAALFPGRIDLGLGRAPGTSAGIAYALQRDRRQAAPDDFPDQLPSVEKAEAFLAHEGVAAETLPVGRRIIVGTPEKVRAMLEEVVKDYGAEELFVVNIMHEHEKRKRSYELIARAFGLV